MKGAKLYHVTERNGDEVKIKPSGEWLVPSNQSEKIPAVRLGVIVLLALAFMVLMFWTAWVLCFSKT